MIVHIPNEGKRSFISGFLLKKIGMRKGFPDFFIPCINQKYGGLFIELKRKYRSKETTDQLWWRQYLTKKGYKSEVAFGCDQAIQIIENYYKNID